MRTSFRLLVLLCATGLVCSGPAISQQKLAQTGMKFLSVESDPRAVALGGAFTALEGMSSAVFFNPAGTARIQGTSEVFVGYTQWIADIKHYFGSVSISPSKGDYGVVTLFVQAVDYGEFEQTIRYNNAGGYLDLEPFNPKGLAFGAGYARALSEKFSIGGNIKWVSQNMGEAVIGINTSGGSDELTTVGNKANSLAFDFGILYKTGFKSLNFAMCVRNFGNEARYVNEGFQLPLTFRIGFSMDVLDLMQVNKDMHALLVVVDAEHPRDFQEQLKLGMEYLFMKRLALRVGYVFPADEHGVSMGLGLRQPIGDLGIGFDYAYTPFGVFGNVQRFGVLFTF
jgi:hypothetical protein